MPIASAVHGLNLAVEVFFLDLLLSGDNAVVIALACRTLPDRHRRQALFAGTGIAILMRILLTLLASLVLQVPVLKLLGGIALTVIAIQLVRGGDDEGAEAGAGQGADLLSVIGTIAIADLVMSTDNVLALAAVAQGRWGVLLLGLLLSVPLLMFGSWSVIKLIERQPLLVPAGAALLGWLAGDIAVSDPLYANWVSTQSPALRVVVPALMAAYVLLQSRIIEQSAPAVAGLRPAAVARSPGRPREPALAMASPVPPAVASPVAVGPVDPVAAVTAVAAVDPAAAERPAGPRWRRWALTATVLSGLGIGVALIAGFRMPAPGGLRPYECPAGDISLAYRPGGQRIRISNGVKTVDGIVRYDNQIDWGDLHDASAALGFVPPTRVTLGTPTLLRIDGGMFENMSCSAR